ncbi:cytosolic phospholipase A2-like isoform X2 [Mytilus californianus]|uniref:cytosolic phospholipase A2-like isoform X2 n=1 Tax=Mytilus californianus TaxID=6549 RepID=UPI0022452455|nr:cytosolic phospholipase A2-like isoform X2 [Mytilus californianus]XP_052104757.1 cytosolic phospholipase A2-like isoform X2 [Mytilus californianus]
MQQNSLSKATCKAGLTKGRSLTVSNLHQKGQDGHRTRCKSYHDEPNSLHQIQNIKHQRKSSRSSKVMFRAKCKSIIKVTDMTHEDIIVKENKQEVERVPAISELIEFSKKMKRPGKTINPQSSEPQLKFPDLRTFDDSKGFLCDQEQAFQEKRKKEIRSSLNKLLNTALTIDNVPHIALMGSGGGYRAMVAMSGIMNALYDTNILDCILYTAALSGSSWYIATLYSDPDWPNVDPKNVQEKIKTAISVNPKNIPAILLHGLKLFSKKLKGKEWNLTTDVFAPTLGKVLIPKRFKCKWSDQADKLSEGTVPLPLLSAIHAKDQQSAQTFHEWVEFSPYEVIIPKYGAAINMRNFGSEFYKGVLTKQNKEIPLYKIMGICGSAYTQNLEEMKHKDSCIFMKKQTMLNSKNQIAATQIKVRDQLDTQGSEAFDELDGPCRNHEDNNSDSYQRDNSIKSLGYDVQESNVCLIAGSNDSLDEEDEDYCVYQSVTSEPSMEEKEELEDLFKTICQIREEEIRLFEEQGTTDGPELTEVIRNDSVFDQDEVTEKNGGRHQMQKDSANAADEIDGYFVDTYVKQPLKETFLKSRRHRAAEINNFLRKISFDETDSWSPLRDRIPLFENYLKNDLEKLCLIDAGLAFNSPYPLLFQPGRDVDLILSFDFTDRKKDSNDPFKTILKAEAWARKHDIKFPKINIEKYKGRKVQELYIFEDEKDPKCPIIMHFVLVNEEFRTFKSPGVERSDREKEFANFTIYDDQSTFHCTNFQYSAENFDRLSQLSEFLVFNNIEDIKACISKSINNKQERKLTGRQRHKTAPL